MILSCQPHRATPALLRSLRVRRLPRSYREPGRGIGIYAEPLGALAFSSLSVFHCQLSAVSFPLSPFPATLTRRPQTIEKTATLSLVFATLTRCVKHNPFVCHSYKKHRGYRIPPSRFSPLATLPSPPALPNPFRITSFADPHPLNPMESYLFKKQGVGEGTTARQFDLAVRPANTAKGRLAVAESFFGTLASDELTLPLDLAPGMPISIARRIAASGASLFKVTVAPSAPTSTPSSFHIAGKSTCTGLAFHSAYNFSITSKLTAWSPVFRAFSKSQSSRISPPASSTPCSASSNPFLFFVCLRISTSATKQKSAPPQYVRPQVCVWSSPASPSCGSPFGMSRTRSCHISSAVQCPARIRAIGSTYTERPSSIQWCSSPIIEGNARCTISCVSIQSSAKSAADVLLPAKIRINPPSRPHVIPCRTPFPSNETMRSVK